MRIQICSYDEKSFEDEIRSPVWEQMLKEVDSEGVTGTKRNFQILKIKVETVLAVHTVTRTKCTETNASETVQTNVDTIKVYYMGKVNGKEDKDINEEIYNRENLLLYGYRSIDGFANWMYLSKRMSGNQAGLSGWYELGQIFHHLGDADNLTSDKLAIEHLAISAVCYSEVEPDDSELYKKEMLPTKKKENIQSYSDIVEQKMKNRKKVVS